LDFRQQVGQEAGQARGFVEAGDGEQDGHVAVVRREENQPVGRSGVARPSATANWFYPEFRNNNHETHEKARKVTPLQARVSIHESEIGWVSNSLIFVVSIFLSWLTCPAAEKGTSSREA
jgi:hypothetical protein